MNPNIIFVLLDGARYDRIHTSKDFMELKKDGCLFNNVTAAYPYTFPAICLERKMVLTLIIKCLS